MRCLIRFDDAQKAVCDGCAKQFATLPCESSDCPIQEALIHVLPVDAAPVVRCKDCALRGDDKCPMMWWEEIVTDDDGWSEYDYTPHDRTTDDGFCHMGRKADDGKTD